MMKLLKTILTVLLLPVFLVFFILFAVLWLLLTITGIGPFAQYLCNISDRNTLDRHKIVKDDSTKSMKVLKIPAGLHSCSKDGYAVFAIYMEPAEHNNFPPICIPNGLGATAVLIAPMQEALVNHGFRVLSFDRLGVGMSDPNTSNRSPSAMDVVNEMDFVMENVLPNQKWLLLGPSMGSIVAQCYIVHHAEKVVGFLNMDGLPYPFLMMRSSFMWAAFIYRVYASIIWTGVLRPFIGAAMKSNAAMFESKSFPISVTIAQMNQSNFFRNVGLEMGTMMDCCEMANAGWGSLSVLRLPKKHLETLICAPPGVSIDFVNDSSQSGTGSKAKNEIRQETTLRSPSERGKDWVSSEEVDITMQYLRSQLNEKSTFSEVSLVKDESGTPLHEPLLSSEGSIITTPHKSLLGDAWSRLVVRVMSGRNHDFGNALANSFYSQEMRDLAGAEHAQHALLAANGYRTAYPTLTHSVMFSKVDDIVRNMNEIVEVLQSRK